MIMTIGNPQQSEFIMARYNLGHYDKKNY